MCHFDSPLPPSPPPPLPPPVTSGTCNENSLFLTNEGGDCGGYSGNDDCDCDYHKGGCSISKAAPKHTACKCSYKGSFTCIGHIVRCLGPESSALCVNPDKSRDSCAIGGGDCDGY